MQIGKLSALKYFPLIAYLRLKFYQGANHGQKHVGKIQFWGWKSLHATFHYHPTSLQYHLYDLSMLGPVFATAIFKHWDIHH